MDQPIDYNSWFLRFGKSLLYEKFSKQPVAYFCAEYAEISDLPTYAGGLGVLASDYIKEAHARQFPLMAVGLFYLEAQNSLTPPDRSHELASNSKNLSLVLDEKKERLLVSVPIHDRIVYAQAWQVTHGAGALYLLDTNISENQPHDRDIVNQLYTDDREMRLKQEMLLGIGGFRLLEKLGLHCSVYHLNEGHSAFLALELVAHEMKHQHVDFFTACGYASSHLVFTNHTLVAAGQEQFTTDLVSAMMGKYAEELAIPIADIVALGTIEGSNLFSMTTLSFKLANKTNAVSKLHATKALEIWPKNPMTSVTNGVYLARWDKVGKAAEKDFWSKHQQNKTALLEYIQSQTGQSWEPNVLLLGWARRLVPYKRPMEIISDVEKFLALALRQDRPLHIVFSGPTNNENENNNAVLVELKKILKDKLSDVAVFLPNYNLELAQLLTAGCDVWVNTPVVGSEACGTSGMKAALNGALPLSTRDGWVAEADLNGIGWVVDEPSVGPKMLELLEQEIIPEYYEQINNPQKSSWITRMQKSRQLISEQFSTSRALKEYIEIMYIQALNQKHVHKYA